MIKRFQFFITIICVNLVQAQSNNVGRLVRGVAPLPDNIAWTVAVSPANPPPKGEVNLPVSVDKFPPAGSLLREENIRSKDVRKETKVFTGGTLIRYVKGPYLLYFDPGSAKVVIEMNDVESFYGGLPLSRFAELSWVKPELFVKEEDYENIKCDVYQCSWPVPNDDELKELPRPTEKTQLPSAKIVTAYINAITRLPVALIDPVSIRKYSFSSTEAALSLPDNFREALKKTEEGLQYRKRLYGADQ